MGKTIMVAVDGSAQQPKVLKEAIDHVVSSDDHVILFRSVELPDYLLQVPHHRHLVEKTCAYVAEEVADAKEIIEGECPDIKVTVVVEEGIGKHKITEFCQKHDTKLDLVIMGVTGESSQNLAGSTTAYVVNHAPSNILVVK